MRKHARFEAKHEAAPSVDKNTRHIVAQLNLRQILRLPGGDLLVDYLDFLAICKTAEDLRNHQMRPNSDL